MNNKSMPFFTVTYVDAVDIYLDLPPKPILTMDKMLLAPSAVRAGTSPPFSVLIKKNVTQLQNTTIVSGM